ncbi:MAG: transglutaminase domain-containing protein [Spirochaetales bacterium]|nr:transglutaminase domain-containing protein [Spirochaetales bacterium]
MNRMQHILDYYSQPAMITRLEKYSAFTQWLTADPGAVYQVAQGLLIHDMWLDKYGIEYKAENAYPQETAYMQDLLDKALELDGGNLATPRAPGKRVIACCREFSTLMCALLRAKGVPARSRCGFAVYFGWTGDYEDHWCCEYRDGGRWITADPQLDPLQESFVRLWASQNEKQSGVYKDQIRNFNPRNITTEDFYTAGRVWKLCREKALDGVKCGISCPINPAWGIDSLHGLWFVRGNLLRDFAALNKVETSPYLVRISKGLNWKSWRLVGAPDKDLTDGDWKLLDKIAELTIDPDGNFSDIRELYQSNQDLRVPDEIIRR